jgi:hypothetical protein
MNSIENLTGGAGNDTLIGNAGPNVLTGGQGADVLWGKGGADTFAYTSYADSNLVTGYDTVADFVTGTSRLDLSRSRPTLAMSSSIRAPDRPTSTSSTHPARSTPRPTSPSRSSAPTRSRYPTSGSEAQPISLSKRRARRAERHLASNPW